MTLVAVWRSDEYLMAIADTRIARGPGNVLTEHGPKILPIKVRGMQPAGGGFADRQAFQFDIGFAYSGGTLPALSAHALASALLGNLAGPPGAPPPSMNEIATFVGGVSAEYIRDVGELGGQGALFTALVFGFCCATQRLRCFQIKPRPYPAPLACEIIERDVEDTNSVVIIGSCPDLLQQRIDADREAAMARGEPDAVRPDRALEALIDEEVDPSVGGMIQQGWATAAGFQLVAKMQPIRPRPPSPRNVGLFVLGFDLMEMQQVGANRVSLLGY